MAGLYFEEFEIGKVYEHDITRTVTEMDNVMFTCLTHNPQPLHLDARGPSLEALAAHGELEERRVARQRPGVRAQPQEPQIGLRLFQRDFCLLAFHTVELGRCRKRKWTVSC